MSGSSRPGGTPVKAGGAGRHKPAGLARHFEGWQPGLLAVFLAGTTAAVVVPRPVASMELPEPTLEPRALERIARADDALARAAAERRPALDRDVRELGSALRAYGKVDGGDDNTVVMERKRVAEAAARARLQGNEALLMLRAFEQASFLRELRRWETEGVESDELRELVGGFVTTMERSGWAPGHRLLMDDAVRRAMFKTRWNELALVHGAPFDPSPAERAAVLRFKLLHPQQGGSSEHGLGLTQRTQRAEHAAAQYRLGKVDELALLDPSYPADLARGVLHFRMHRYLEATRFFRRHLDAHPDGALTLRAQNYLNAALAAETE